MPRCPKCDIPLCRIEIAGIPDIPVEIRLGTPRAAALFSAKANGLHGLRPTKSDKRRAIIRMLEDPDYPVRTLRQTGLLKEIRKLL